jgi:hypothetical protein
LLFNSTIEHVPVVAVVGKRIRHAQHPSGSLELRSAAISLKLPPRFHRPIWHDE